MCLCLYPIHVCTWYVVIFLLPCKYMLPLQTADLASANASEEEKVRAMMNQSSKDYDPSRYIKPIGTCVPVAMCSN